MANKNFFQPVRMESQFVDTKLQTVMFTSSADTYSTCFDGELAVLGKFDKDPVYVNAFTAAGQAASAPVDFNTRQVTAVSNATSKGVGVIDLPNVPMATNGNLSYRMGYKTIGLTAEAGVPVRFRKFVVDDTFLIGEDNCTAALTAGKYAVGGADGKFAPSEDGNEATDGAFQAEVISKFVISQGVNGSISEDGVQAYLLCVKAN